MQRTYYRAHILVASPVRQQRAILDCFLQGLKNLSSHNLELSFLFVDDNVEEDAKEALQNFAVEVPRTSILPTPFQTDDGVGGWTHTWSEELVWKVAELKDTIIEHTLWGDYEALFLVDSDVVVHPWTLEQLQKARKPIISNIFWTSNAPDFPEVPQVWLQDDYNLYEKKWNAEFNKDEAIRKINEFIYKLRKPGVYEVGGLGACTLIHRAVLEKGVNFKKIPNISFWGEDRHFCVRAMAFGFPLYVDTHYPAYHIYRPYMLEGAKRYLEKFQNEEES